MKKIVGEFFAALRRHLFTTRMDRKIHSRFFPDLVGKASVEYPRRASDELCKAYYRSRLEFAENLGIIKSCAKDLPGAYAEAFQHMVFQDLNERLEMHMALAEKHLAANPATLPLAAVTA